MTEPPLLTADAVEICLGGTTILEDLSFTLDHGEFVAVVGPSGSGKTTILRMIARLQTPSGGELAIRGQPRTAYVFQEPNLLPWRTAASNVALPLELQGVPAASQAEQALDLVGLGPSDHLKLPRMLSGGMRMRVSLARALVTQPDILLLDEPFAALDDMLRQRLNEELLRLWFDQQWAALFVTHNVAEAVFLSQKVLVVGGHPASIVRSIDIPFGYPREPDLRGEAEFGRLTLQISNLLREQAP